MSLVDKFADLPAEMLDRLQALHRAEVDKRRREDPVSYFPKHRIQAWVLDAPSLVDRPVRIMLIAGGNRGGKSATGKLLWSEVIRRESPLNRQLTCLDPYTGEIRNKGDADPLNIWVIPPTLEKARQDWIAPSDGMGLRFWAGDRFLKHEQQPDNIIYTKVPGLEPWLDQQQESIDKTRVDKTLIKSHDQALLTFESSEVDLALVDEELLDEAKWNSILLRIATTNGVIVMTYTPLHGLSWSYDRYWKPLVKLGRAEMVAERCWIHEPEKGAVVICAQMGCADNPRARTYAEEIEADPEISDAEKASRLYGEYGFVEGALIPALSGLDVMSPEGSHRQYVIDHLPGQRKPDGSRIPGRLTQWFLVADPNKSHGALLGATDQNGNVYFVTEHLEESWPTRRHAMAFAEMKKRFATGPVLQYADTGSAGAQAIVDLQDLGEPFLAMPKGAGSVSASIKRLRGLTYVDPDHFHPITGEKGAPRLYFYRPGMVTEWEEKGGRQRGCRTAVQISQARQTDKENAPPDTPHKDIKSKLDLFDCARYLAMVATAVDTGEDNRSRRPDVRRDTMPSDEMLSGTRGAAYSMDTPLWLPDYYFD